jgi:hypothetical protein
VVVGTDASPVVSRYVLSACNIVVEGRRVARSTGGVLALTETNGGVHARSTAVCPRA